MMDDDSGESAVENEAAGVGRDESLVLSPTCFRVSRLPEFDWSGSKQTSLAPLLTERQ